MTDLFQAVKPFRAPDPSELQDDRQWTVEIVPCPRCNSTEWVCEFHPDKPWGDAINGGPRACHCGGAGKPCPECNPLSKERSDGR